MSSPFLRFSVIFQHMGYMKRGVEGEAQDVSEIDLLQQLRLEQRRIDPRVARNFLRAPGILQAPG